MVTARFGRVGLPEGVHPGTLIRSRGMLAEVVEPVGTEYRVQHRMILTEIWVNRSGWVLVGTPEGATIVEEWHVRPDDQAASPW